MISGPAHAAKAPRSVSTGPVPATRSPSITIVAPLDPPTSNFRPPRQVARTMVWVVAWLDDVPAVSSPPTVTLMTSPVWRSVDKKNGRSVRAAGIDSLVVARCESVSLSHTGRPRLTCMQAHIHAQAHAQYWCAQLRSMVEPLAARESIRTNPESDKRFVAQSKGVGTGRQGHCGLSPSFHLTKHCTSPRASASRCDRALGAHVTEPVVLVIGAAVRHVEECPLQHPRDFTHAAGTDRELVHAADRRHLRRRSGEEHLVRGVQEVALEGHFLHFEPGVACERQDAVPRDARQQRAVERRRVHRATMHDEHVLPGALADHAVGAKRDGLVKSVRERLHLDELPPEE